ncbi:MAG TPA: ERAP1-like C-terminal domain-containing protein, partial [Bryobacteraceae bacterium]|nr:ERAP1-like C-terminal domain-containing protein [Bryobacteraceae bacterium]
APSVTIRQNRYLPIGSDGSKDQVWQIPVCVKYRTAQGVEKECFLLDRAREDFKLAKASSCPAELAANDNGSGYYIAGYQGSMLEKLVDQGEPFLDTAEQITLLHDLRSLSDGGSVKESVTLGAVPVYAKSAERQVVSQAQGIANGVRALVPANLLPNYARFVRKMFSERAEALGWSAKPGDDSETRLLRAGMVPFVAVNGEDEKLQREARRLAGEWLRDRKGVDPDMLSSVLSTAAHSGDRALFDRLLEELKKTDDRSQRRAILGALGSFRDPKLVDAAHELVLHSDIDARESGMLIFAGRNDPKTERMPFQFVKTNYEELIKRLPTGGGSDFGAALPEVVAGCDAQAMEEIKFFEDRVKQFAGGPRTYQQAVESLRLCTARKAALGPDVVKFFEKQ